MEWQFCGLEGQCWASWFWNSGTGAILQFIATVALLFLTFCTWRHDRRSEGRRRHLDEKANVKKVGLMIGGAKAYIGRLLNSEEVYRGFEANQISVTQNILVKYQSLLMEMTLQPLLDTDVVVEISLAWSNLEEAIQYLSGILKIGSQWEELAQDKKDALPSEIRRTLEQLRNNLDRRLSSLGVIATNDGPQ